MIETEVHWDYELKSGDAFVITMGLDRCLLLMNSEMWSSFEEFLNLILDKTNRGALERFFIGNAWNIEITDDGHLEIPNHLLIRTGIQHGAFLYGKDGMAQIWGKYDYDKNANLCNSGGIDALEAEILHRFNISPN